MLVKLTAELGKAMGIVRFESDCLRSRASVQMLLWDPLVMYLRMKDSDFNRGRKL